MTSKFESFHRLVQELQKDFRGTHDFSAIRSRAQALDSFGREQLIMSLFGEALNARDWPLAEACIEENPEFIAPSEENPSDWGPIWGAFGNLGDCPDVIAWLIARGADVERRGANNRTPLMTAAACGWQECVKLLLEKGADPNARTIIDDNITPLMAAAIYGGESAVNLLLIHGANRELRDNWQHTAAQLAEHHGHFGIARLIRDFSH